MTLAVLLVESHVIFVEISVLIVSIFVAILRQNRYVQMNELMYNHYLQQKMTTQENDTPSSPMDYGDNDGDSGQFRRQPSRSVSAVV